LHISDHKVWREKHEHFKYATDLDGGSLKVINLYVGWFLEDSLTVSSDEHSTKEGGSLNIFIQPLWGFDTKNKIYRPCGSVDAAVSWTGIGDISRTVAELICKAVVDRNSVPNEIRISGDVKSYKEIAEIVGHQRGETIQVKGLDWDAKQAELDEKAHREGLLLEYLK
jgi:hypothetical protein